MPEGDSLFIAARKLHEVLANQVIIRLATPRPELKERDVEGPRVLCARAHGKYVVIELDDATLARLLKRARELMRRNLGRGPRRTTFGSYASSNYWVYERSGQRCMKCDAKIGMRRQGALQRSTYFCPDCQSVVAAPPGT